MLTVAELSEYIRTADKLLTKGERNELAELVGILIEAWRKKRP